MKIEKTQVGSIPVLIWGEASENVYLYVHGGNENKYAAENFAPAAQQKGWQTVSFDLPEHGERKWEGRRCSVWNAGRDLEEMAGYVFKRWKRVRLFANNTGALMCLYACPMWGFERALFQSPVLDMPGLVTRLLERYHLTQDELEEKGELETPVGTLSWESYQFVKEHPPAQWPFSTSILYAGKDELQSYETVAAFCRTHGGSLSISLTSGHDFQSRQDTCVLEWWYTENI